MESPIRVYRLKPNAGRKILFDILSAIFVSLFYAFATKGIEYAGLTVLLGLLSFWAGSFSVMERRRGRVRFSLYPDRIEWRSFWGSPRSSPFNSIDPPQPFLYRLDMFQGIRFSTSVGEIPIPHELEGFGDLTRSLEGAHRGWVDRDLPPSNLPWRGAHFFNFRGTFRPLAIFTSFLGVVGILLSMTSQNSTPGLFALLLPSLALVASAFLDIVKAHNARVELINGRLVEFDRWGKPVNSVGISTLHHVSPLVSPLMGGVRIDGDDGHIALDREMKRGNELLENVYAIIADRHHKALESPMREEREETVLTAPLQIQRS